jgi:hypothetical protein
MQLIHVYGQLVTDDDGTGMEARVYGEESPDGSWTGLHAFVPVDGGPPLVGARELTEDTREALRDWAAEETVDALLAALRRTRSEPGDALDRELVTSAWDDPSQLGAYYRSIENEEAEEAAEAVAEEAEGERPAQEPR